MDVQRTSRAEPCLSPQARASPVSRTIEETSFVYRGKRGFLLFCLFAYDIILLTNRDLQSWFSNIEAE